MKESAVATLVALICITWLESIALLLGINGIMMASTFMLIAGLAGYQGHKYIYARRRKR